MIQVALISIFAATALRAPDAAQVLDRYVQFKKRATRYEASYTAIVPGGRIDCFVRVEALRRLLFTAAAAGQKYLLLETPSGCSEQNSAILEYDEYPYQGRVVRPSSRLSVAPRYLAPWIFSDDMRGSVPRAAGFQVTGSSNVRGVRCDHLRSAFKTPDGKVQIDADVADDGRPMTFHIVSDGQHGHSDMEFDLKRFAPKSSFSDQAFSLSIPVGYTPYALQVTYGSLRMGESVPLDGWKPVAGTGDLKRSLGPSKTLLFIEGSDSPPSKRALDSLPRLRKLLPVVLISDSPQPGGAKGTQFYDSTQKLLDKISPPATPYFLLIDKTGKILRIWMGYDADHAQSFESEVAAAIK